MSNKIYYDDLKYVGDNPNIKLYDNNIFHCTESVHDFETNESRFIIRIPIKEKGEVFYGANTSVFVIDSNTLYNDFKIVKEDGELEDIEDVRPAAEKN